MPLPFTLVSLDAAALEHYRRDLVTLLADAVNGGASVSFLAPLDPEIAHDYWRNVALDVAGGRRVVLAALDVEREAAAVVGCVHLVLDTPPNGRHRADVQKLLVRSSHRRRGIAAALMARAEVEAQRLGRSLLVLDTQAGSSAETLYARLGYCRAGVIPRYALNYNGSELIETVLFYKLL